MGAMNNKGKTSEDVWRTSVTELVRTFRDSLAAIAPVLEAARFHTEEPDTSNGWDDVADAIFENVVGRSIRWSLEVGRDVHLGPYATIHRDYEERDRIEVISPDRRPSELIFLCLVSSRERFDSVSALTSTKQEAIVVPFAAARFVFRPAGASSPIDSLSVEL